MPTPIVNWLTCPDCKVMWHSPLDVPCWMCGRAGQKSRSPLLNSQTGSAPPVITNR